MCVVNDDNYFTGHGGGGVGGGVPSTIYSSGNKIVVNKTRARALCNANTANLPQTVQLVVTLSCLPWRPIDGHPATNY